MRVKDEHFQQRAFILSSFRRLKIEFTTSVYKFTDKDIQEGWMPPLGSLDEVDAIIKDKFENYINQ